MSIREEAQEELERTLDAVEEIHALASEQQESGRRVLPLLEMTLVELRQFQDMEQDREVGRRNTIAARLHDKLRPQNAGMPYGYATELIEKIKEFKVMLERNLP